MRNNCGSYKSPTGTFVRYGVGSPGGSDLIGLRRVTITPQMVGQQIGQFVAVEVKQPGKRPTAEQQQFMAMVRDFGGLAGVATSPEQAQEMLATDLTSDPIPLSELGLDTGTYHALRRAGIEWVHEVETLSSEALVAVPLIGADRAARIRVAISEWHAG